MASIGNVWGVIDAASNGWLSSQVAHSVSTVAQTAINSVAAVPSRIGSTVQTTADISKALSDVATKIEASVRTLAELTTSSFQQINAFFSLVTLIEPCTSTLKSMQTKLPVDFHSSKELKMLLEKNDEMIELIQAFKQLRTQLNSQASDPTQQAATHQEISAMLARIKDKWEELKQAWDNAGVYLGTISTGTPKPLQELTPPQDPKDRETLQNEFKQALSQLGICLRRKAEITAVFGHSAPTVLLNTVNLSGNGAEATYIEAFQGALAAQKHLTAQELHYLLPFLNSVIDSYYKIKSFIAGYFANYLIMKAEALVRNNIERLTDPGKTSPKDAKMEFMRVLSATVFDGLSLLNENLAHAADALVDLAAKERDGRLKEMLPKELAKKNTLRANRQTDQDLYIAFVDKILAYHHSSYIFRAFVRNMIKIFGLLEDPLKELPNYIQNQQGYSHSTNIAISQFYEALITGFNTRSATEPSSSGDTFPSFSPDTTQNLANALCSLIPALAITEASNLTKLKTVRNAATKPGVSDIDPHLINAAQTILESLDTVLSPEFILTQTTTLLNLVNSSFSPPDKETSVEEMETAQQRKQALETQFIETLISTLLKNSTFLHPEIPIKNLNKKLSHIRNMATTFLSDLQNDRANIGSIEIIQQELKKLEQQSSRETPPIHQAIEALKGHIEKIKPYITNPDTRGESNPELTEALTVFEKDLEEGSDFADRAQILPSDTLPVNLSQMAIWLFKQIAEPAKPLIRKRIQAALNYLTAPSTIKYLFVHQVLAKTLLTED